MLIVHSLRVTVVSLLVLITVSCLSATTYAQTKPKRTDVGGATPNSILWVGNSFFYYNNSMHSHVGALVRAADPKSAPRATSLTISGSGIDWHDMDSYFRPNGLGKYSFVGDNEIVFKQARTAIRRRYHCGLQPVSHTSPTQGRVPRTRQEAERRGSGERCTPNLLYDVGLQGQTGDDGPAGGAIHHRGQR